MDLDTLAKLGEFIGGFFVVVSLVYLAHQVRQNTKSLKTENYARVLDRMSTLQSRLSSDRELNRLVATGAESPGSLSASDRVRFAWALYELFGAAEFMYHQARQDALPEEVWARWEASLAWWLSHPGIRAWWDAKPAPLASDFQAFVAELLRRDPVEPAAIRRWELFVAGEGLPNESPAVTAAPGRAPAPASPSDGREA